MKELSLHTFFDDAPRDAGPHDVCRWLAVLAGVPEAAPAGVPARLLCEGTPDEIEIWTADASLQEGVAVYRRVLFRPVKEEGAGWRIEFELLPDVGVYTALPLTGLGLVDGFPQRVVMDGQVFLSEGLGAEQMRRLDEARAVLTPRLAEALGVKCPPVRRVTYAALQDEAERRLAACFPGGGELPGCPLRVDLRLADVPADCFFTVPTGQRRLCYGMQGKGVLPRRGLELYGAFKGSPHRRLTVVMIYPEGRLDDARRLFGLLGPLSKLIAAMPCGNVERWVAYRADGTAVERLTSVLYAMQAVAGASAGSRLYCYLSPGRDAPALPRGAELSTRLLRLVRSFGSLFVGPVPLHAISAEAFGWRLPAVASDLLAQLGGVPWVQAEEGVEDDTLLAGFSCLRRGVETFCAAAFCLPSSLCCTDEVCRASRGFAPFFGRRFRMACDRFADLHAGRLPERLVVYCHHDVPPGELSALAEEVGDCRLAVPVAEKGGKALPLTEKGGKKNGKAFPMTKKEEEEDGTDLPAVPVVVARVRLLADRLPRCYDPDAGGCMPAAGTCLRCGDGRMLLFCREALPACGRRQAFHPAPLEVRFHRLAADGTLLPLPAGEAEELAAQTCRLVWNHPVYVDGSALPPVLSYTDRLARLRHREWQVEEAGRRAILEGRGGVAF